MRVNIKLDYKGISEVAKSEEMQRAIEDLTEKVADNVRSQGLKVANGADLPVETKTRVTDRARGRVTLAHPAGLGMQAKHGALTRAASEAGLEVKGE